MKDIYFVMMLAAAADLIGAWFLIDYRHSPEITSALILLIGTASFLLILVIIWSREDKKAEAKRREDYPYE